MDIVIKTEGDGVTIHVNEKKHPYYGYRAVWVEKDDHWRDSDNSQAEAIGKLVLAMAWRKK